MTENIAQAHVTQTAALLKVPLPPDLLSGVTANFLQLCAMADLFTEFPLPPESESAQVFEP